jgi:hypothetical protein
MFLIVSTVEWSSTIRTVSLSQLNSKCDVNLTLLVLMMYTYTASPHDVHLHC